VSNFWGQSKLGFTLWVKQFMTLKQSTLASLAPLHLLQILKTPTLQFHHKPKHLENVSFPTVEFRDTHLNR
jgi:hypothetical protein